MSDNQPEIWVGPRSLVQELSAGSVSKLVYNPHGHVYGYLVRGELWQNAGLSGLGEECEI